jgi:arylsulfatase/uncharacterized sulfatase
MGTLVEAISPAMEPHPGYSMEWASDQQTIASLLRGAGYRTFVAGKWGIGRSGANLPHRFGFDRSFVMDSTGGSNFDKSHYLPGYGEVPWFEDGAPAELPADYYSSRSLVDKLIAYIDEGDADRPFFGFLSLQAIHIPVQAPRSYVDGYDGVFDAGWDALREEKLARVIERGLVPASARLAPVRSLHRDWDALSAEQQRVAAREMQVNAGMIEAADENIGRLLDHLAASGMLEDTVVIITSDNGAESARTELPGAVANAIFDGIKLIEGWDTSYDNLGQKGSLTAIGPEWAAVSSAPFDLYKFYSSEGGLRVPLVIAGPGVAATGILDAPVHVSDLVPTLLDAAGLPYDPASFYGRSAMPVLSGTAVNHRSASDGFGFEVSGNAAFYRGKWKVTRLAPPLGDSQWRLYDIASDPGETTDLAGQEPEVFASMVAQYEAYSRDVGVFEIGPEDSAFRQLSRNLTAKSASKYWPYALALLVAVLAALYLIFRLLRAAFSRAR